MDALAGMTAAADQPHADRRRIQFSRRIFSLRKHRPTPAAHLVVGYRKRRWFDSISLGRKRTNWDEAWRPVSNLRAGCCPAPRPRLRAGHAAESALCAAGVGGRLRRHYSAARPLRTLRHRRALGSMESEPRRMRGLRRTRARTRNHGRRGQLQRQPDGRGPGAG